MESTDRARAILLAVLLIAGCGAPAVSEPPSATVTCNGVPQDKCDEAVASARRSLPNTAIASIEVVCVADRCSDESGAMDTIVRTAGGGTLRSPTTNWWGPAGGGEPSPGTNPDAQPGSRPPAAAVPSEAAVPLRPQCHGVPVATCELMAETAFGELSIEGVEHVLVRCGALEPCTTDRGLGETIVTYADGSTKSSAWEYDLD